ncbi:MAG: pirin family protein [Alphaproteobacteria bacterium]|nr:MAG: pirin family protein [Alphaproteobacteria bacterium]
MIKIRKSEARGAADHGWLKAKHTFSFAGYQDPAHMGFGPLRVINEDRIAGGGGFPTHPHDNMEIVTYVMSGALEHKDSMGNRGVIKAGDIQYMSAGTGVRHSEFNASATEETHLYQIWLLPNERGAPPRYAQKSLVGETRSNELNLFVSGDGREGSTEIRQDADLYTSTLDAGKEIVHRFEKGRLGWLQLARGVLDVNGERLEAGDGVALAEEDLLAVKALESAEFLLFDMAA